MKMEEEEMVSRGRKGQHERKGNGRYRKGYERKQR